MEVAILCIFAVIFFSIVALALIVLPPRFGESLGEDRRSMRGDHTMGDSPQRTTRTAGPRGRPSLHVARADARRRLRRLKAGTTVATVLGFAGSAVASPCSRGDSHKGHGDGGAPDPDAIGDFVRWLYQTRRL